MNNSQIDIFKTPFRKLILSVIKTPIKIIPTSTVQSFNIAYPTTATSIQFNPQPGPGTYNPSKPKRINKINFSASQRQSMVSKKISELGPGDFQPKKISSTSVKIGTSKRPPLAIPTSAPLLKVLSSKEVHLILQPKKFIQDLAQEFTILFPKSQRHDFTKQKRGIPGPQTPSYSFGKCKR